MLDAFRFGRIGQVIFGAAFQHFSTFFSLRYRRRGQARTKESYEQIWSATTILCRIACVPQARAQIATPQVFAWSPAALWILSAWIGAATPSVSSTSGARFDLASEAASFTVHVSADNRYRLFVNGQTGGSVRAAALRPDALAVRDGRPGPTASSGPNVLAALVLELGRGGPVAQFSRQSAFLMQGDTEREAIAKLWVPNGRHSGTPATSRFRSGAVPLAATTRRRRASPLTRDIIPGAGRSRASRTRLVAAAVERRGCGAGRAQPSASILLVRHAGSSCPARFLRWRSRRFASRPCGGPRVSRPMTASSEGRATSWCRHRPGPRSSSTMPRSPMPSPCWKRAEEPAAPSGPVPVEALKDAKGEKGNRNEIEGQDSRSV